MKHPLPRVSLAAWVGRALLWLPAALVGAALAGALALGGWAASEGSLATALRWALAWQAANAPQLGQLRVDGVSGSVLGGGRVQELQWTQADTRVQAEGVRLRLGGRFWLAALGARVQIAELHADRLSLHPAAAQAPSAPRDILRSLTLPLPVEGSVSIDTLDIQGATPVRATELRLRYRYGRAEAGLGVADAHTVQLQSLRWAEGRYRGHLTLGAQSPMPLHAEIDTQFDATVPEGRRLALRGRASAQGTLAGEPASVAITAQVESASATDATPTLAGTARLRPWARQPVAEADLRLHRFNTALLWPGAPLTALTGTVTARPEGEAWRAQLRLSNHEAGPLDRSRVPLQSLDAALRQQGERWTLEALRARGAGADWQAQGERSGPGGPGLAALGDWRGTLSASGVNPALIWSRLAPAALQVQLSARAVPASPAAPAIDIDARLTPSGRQPSHSAAQALRLRELLLQARWQPEPGNAVAGTLSLQRAALDALDGRLDAQGTLVTAPLRAQGRVALDLPGLQSRWQGTAAYAEGSGELALQLGDAARLFAWLDALSELPGLNDGAREALATLRGWAPDGAARAALHWQGGLGALGFPGTGTAAAPRVTLSLDSERLRLSTRPAPGDTPGDAPAPLQLQDLRLRASGPLDELDIDARGTLGLVGPPGWRGTIETAGHLTLADGVRSVRRGALRLERLQARVAREGAERPDDSPWSAALREPLAARWQPRDGAIALEIDPAAITVRPDRAANGTDSATLQWERFSWHAGALRTLGRLQGIPLAWVDMLSRTADPSAPANTLGPLARAGLGGDLVFDGRWDIALPALASEPPRVRATLTRRSGDLAVQTDGAFDDNARRTLRVQAGVKTAQFDVDTDGQRVRARLRWDSERFGEATAEASTDLSPPGGEQRSWHWAGNAPLSGRLQARLPEVGVWSVLAPPGWRVRGSLQADATLGGTRSAPQFGGSLQARELAMRSLVNGIVLRNGELRATLAGERVIIERLRIEGRGGAERGGTLSAQGSAEWPRVLRNGASVREPLIELQVTAERLRASVRADRRLTVSGELRARLQGPALQLRGRLRADEALIVLPDELAPSLGSDVVVRGTEFPIEPANGVRVQPDVQVTLDLGPAFELRGQGLQTRLAGELEVRSLPTQPTPRVFGEVRTASGSYRAYGQRLGIETGVLRFNGPYDNPALDITAVRPNSAQRVGVQIGGTAQAPRVRLFSEPELPDSEKLAWLVLGRPASGAGAEAAVLQQAALALLAGQDGAADGGLAQALGLDTLGFSGSSTAGDTGTSSAALTLGKRISDELYVSYERGLASTLNTVSIFYDVSRRFTLRARAGSENAIDLIFTIRHD